MWAVHELLENDFEDFMLTENMRSEKLFENAKSNILYDSKYYIRLPMKKMDDKRFPKLRESFEKRKERFLEALSTATESILFIRSEEHDCYCDWGNRIPKEEYEEKYQHDEHHYLNLFSDSLKIKYPSLNFKILFLNKNGQFVDESHNIVGIDAPTCNYRDKNIGKEIKEIIKANEEYLNTNLKLH